MSPFGSITQSPDQGVFFENSEIDRLLREAASTPNSTRRAELYKSIGDIYAEEVVTLPFLWESTFVAYRKGVQNVMVGPSFEFNYHILSFAEGTYPASGSTDAIVIGTTYEVQSLDAHDAHARSDWEILKNTGVALMSYIPGTAELIPGAAEEFPTVSNDGKTYTFKLRDGIRFADGTPLTAHDYVNAWKRLNMLEGQVSGLVQVYVDDVEAVDGRRVSYHLNNSYAFFADVAAAPAFIPVNPNEFPLDRLNQFPKRLDGIGAYRLVSYGRTQPRILEPNPLYFGNDKPKIPRVTLRYFPNSSSRAESILAGEIDIAWRNLGLVEALRLMQVDGLEVLSINTPVLQYLTFNHAYKL